MSFELLKLFPPNRSGFDSVDWSRLRVVDKTTISDEHHSDPGLILHISILLLFVFVFSQLTFYYHFAGVHCKAIEKLIYCKWNKKKTWIAQQSQIQAFSSSSLLFNKDLMKTCGWKATINWVSSQVQRCDLSKRNVRTVKGLRSN